MSTSTCKLASRHAAVHTRAQNPGFQNTEALRIFKHSTIIAVAGPSNQRDIFPVCYAAQDTANLLLWERPSEQNNL